MQQKIKNLLLESLQDRRLDQDEKNKLRELVTSLKDDEKRYLRNQAFDLVREKMATVDLDSAYPMQLMGWLERIVKLIDNNSRQLKINSRVYFSPGDACRDGILDLLSQARQRVDICVFTISDNRLSESILAVHQNNIPVRILTDNDKANDRGSDIYYLQEAGVPVAMDTSPSHMHHKFALIDNCLVNGSFNWTRSASERNQENLVVSDNPALTEEFGRAFNQLWQRFS